MIVKMASEDLNKRMKTIKDYFEEMQAKEANVLDISHDGKKVSNMKKLYDGKFEDTIDEYQKNEGRMSKENFVPLVELQEICEHLHKKYIKIEKAKNTKLLVKGRHVEIECTELAEQAPMQFTPNDRVKIKTTAGSALATYEGTIGDIVLLMLSKSHDGLLEGGTLVSLCKKEGDAHIYGVLKNLNDMPDELLNYLFPPYPLKSEEYKRREKWVYDTQKMNKEHRDFIHKVCKRHYKQPIILQGCCGSGKSHAIADMVVTYLRNDPQAKIVIGSVNNAAVDSLLLKILKKAPGANIVRPVALQHKGSLPEKLASPDVAMDSMDEGLEKFAFCAIMGLTVSKATDGRKVGGIYHTGIDADLIVLDEAGTAGEYATASFIGSFINYSKTNVVLAGDIYQNPGLVMSPHAESLGMKNSTMKRLLTENKGYRPNSNDRDPPVAWFKNCYRGPEVITELISNFYDQKLNAIPNEEKVNRFANLPHMPKGHIIYHPSNGVQKFYTNKHNSISNDAEAKIVLRYINVLVNYLEVQPKNIMVIPYYNKQIKVITKALERAGMPVASSEDQNAILVTSPIKAQGLERGIVLVSLVQAGNRKMGKYLQNPNQNLVALSRASSLLIVTGQKELLNTDKNWKRVTKYEIDGEETMKRFDALAR